METGHGKPSKYRCEGCTTVAQLKEFVNQFYEKKLTPYFKSEPVPETQEDVQKVVAKNFK